MEVCRLCNVSNPRGLFYHIFDNSQTNPTIPEIVEMLTDIKIVEDDPYTKMICFNCYNVLITIHKYRERILETNRSLKKSFHENSSLICCNEKNEQFDVDFDNSDADSDCEMNLQLGSDSEDKGNHCSSTSNEDNDELFEENNVICSDEEENQRIDNNNQYRNKSIDCALSEIKIVGGQNFENESHECDICHKKWKRKLHLIRHYKLHKDGNFYTCHFCNNQFIQKTNLTDHLKQHTGEKPYTCNICDKRFRRISNFHMHLKIHTGEKPYTCNICDKRFTQKSNLKRHLKIHAGSDSEDEDNHYSSTSNDEDYNEKLHENNVVGSNEDENHRIDNHQFPNKSIDCAPNEIEIVDANNYVEDNSDKLVSNGQNLNNDYYECDICGKKCKLKVLLIRHFKLHRDKKLYKCHFCNRKFTQKTNLTVHLKQHTDEKLYTCNICGNRFTIKYSLVRHLKIHTGEKPYTCNFCDRRFIQKSDLNRHLKTHTGEKPFTCNKCDERFPLLTNLKFHLKKVHKGEKPNE